MTVGLAASGHLLARVIPSLPALLCCSRPCHVLLAITQTQEIQVLCSTGSQKGASQAREVKRRCRVTMAVCWTL